jgi:hypothetical protein
MRWGGDEERRLDMDGERDRNGKRSSQTVLWLKRRPDTHQSEETQARVYRDHS